MKLILTIFLISFSFANCIQKEPTMKINYFKAGILNEILLNKSEYDLAFQNINKLIEGIDDEARLIVDDERIEELRLKDELIEILFDKKNIFNSGEFKNYSIGKILLPVSGDLSSTENENAVIILLGADNYDSSPYINSSGKNILKNISDIIIQSRK